MKRLLTALPLCLFCASGLAATTVLECDYLLDVDSGKLLENRQVLVEDRRIAAIGRAVDGAFFKQQDSDRQ